MAHTKRRLREPVASSRRTFDWLSAAFAAAMFAAAGYNYRPRISCVASRNSKFGATDINVSFSGTAKIYAFSSLLALFLTSTSPSFGAPVVTSVEVAKSIDMLQTGPATVGVNFTEPGGGPYGFAADVDGQNIGLLSPAPIVTGPIHASASFQNGGVLGFNPTERRVGGHPVTLYPGGWRYGAPSFNDFGTTSISDLDAKFNNGTYHLTVNGTSFSLTLSGPNGADEFPNTPILTVSGGAWSGGKYLIDPSQALTITTNAFSAYGQNSDDYMFLGSLGSMNQLIFSESQFFSDVPGTNFLTFTVPAFTFVGGNDYVIVADFRLVTDSSNAIAGSQSNAFFEIDTDVQVSAVPEPASLGLVALGLAGLGLSRRRKSD